jgi:hypothetical protein
MGGGDREAFSDASTKPMARACAPEDVELEAASGPNPARDATRSGRTDDG